jgi:hypothetical protein
MLLRDERARIAQAQRTTGYNDGFHGRPAASRESVYQQAWRRGREARQAMQDGTDAA